MRLAQLRAADGINPKATARSCILIWLDGGPSHLESFDLKPDAPAEVRGPFRAVDTNVPGIKLCEHLARTAVVCGQTGHSAFGNLSARRTWLGTSLSFDGYHPTPVLEYPSLGSVVSRMQVASSALPGYVAIPELRSGGAGYLGQRFEPFSTRGDLSSPHARIRDLDLYPEVTDLRFWRDAASSYTPWTTRAELRRTRMCRPNLLWSRLFGY